MILEWAFVALLAAAFVTVSVSQGATRAADNLAYDGLLRFDQREPRGDIVVVAIDNRSLEALGRWPWPRQRHAQLFEALAKARPKAIGYDVLFVEPATDPADDLALASAMRSAAPTVLPLLLEPASAGGEGPRVTPPVAPIAAAAAGVGHANLTFDADGVVRSVFLSEGDGARSWPHMMQIVSRLADSGGGATPPAAKPVATGDLRGQSNLLIPFVGPPGSFRTVSFVDALRGEIPADVFRGKIVLVGATADGLQDHYPTPVSSRTELLSGIEFQANVLDALLGHRFIRPLPALPTIGLSLLPLAALMAGFLWLRPRQNMLLGLCLFPVPLVGSAVLLLLAKVWFAPTTAATALVLVYPLWSWRRLAAASAYIVEELKALQREPDPLPVPAADTPRFGGDAIDRQVRLMHGAVQRVRDLRRFMWDTIRSLPDPTLVTDTEGRILIANAAAEALILGATGQSPVGWDLVPMLDAIAIDAPARPDAGLAGLAGLAGQRYEFATSGGGAFELRSTAFLAADGGVGGWIVRLADITAIRTAERQRERVLQLLSHDMRSPQVSILTLVGGQEGGAGLDADGLRRIDGYARRTLALADDFLTLARAERPDYAIETLDFADLLIEAIDALWPQSEARSVTVSTTGCDREWLVAADRGLMLRVLVNLIDNAIKFSDPSGAVACELQPLADAPAELACHIRDHGRGMSPETLAGLFQPFHRGADDGPAVQGVGLGLTFVRTVVERHGGRVTCVSAPGAGATFTVRLPLLQAAKGDI